MERAEVVSRLRQSEVQLVRLLFCDNAGIIRGKAVHVDELEARLVSGVGIPRAVQALNVLDQQQPVNGMGPVGEVRLAPDADTFVVLPYAPRSAAMIADLLTPDGGAWDACPREFLRRMTRRALGHGLQVRAAFEPEWSLAIRVEDRYVPIDETLGLSSLGMQTAAAAVDEIVEALGKQGMRVEHYVPELGHGQQELTIRHAPALRAADNQLLYRETVRSIAYKQGYFASFAPKPWPEQPGNGCHIHVSVWDPSGEENLFSDRSAPYGLGRLGRRFAAGLLAHVPGLLGLVCPSYNSYQRLRPGAWSSAYGCWGPDNREAAVRVASTLAGRETTSINLELRPADGSANPYLALGGVIAAGLDGIVRDLDLSDDLLALADPASLSDEDRESRGIRRHPETLALAADALEADPLLTESLGPVLSSSYLAVRRSEWHAFSAQNAAFEHKHHFWKY